MKVTTQDVSYVADLANLELTDKERQGMVRDLNSILDYVDLLNELDTSSIQAMAQVSDRYYRMLQSPTEPSSKFRR